MVTDSSDEPLKVLNVRIGVELFESVDSAARMAEVSRSEWVREALEAGVRAERSAYQAAKARRLGGAAVGTVVCVHPKPGLRMQGVEVVCGVCGQVVRRLL